MAVETGEYRKRLLAQGCDEGLADAVLALVGEARDDAVAEAIARTGEQVKTSDQVLAERLNGHVGKTEGQFNSLMSTIRGTASDLTTMFERRFTQLWDRINGLETEVKGELTEVRGEVEGLKGELGGRIDGVKGDLGGRIDGVKGEVEGLKGELGGQIDGVKGDLGGRIDGVKGELKGEIVGLKGEIEGLKTKIDGLEKALRAELKGAVARSELRLATLMIGLFGVLIGLMATGVLG